ncbi:MAG: terminase small subunit [Myxococcota bacterium]|nr:terminase small subunit [Myxococcota bacterium]
MAGLQAVKNARQEAFCQFVAAGRLPPAAAREAGYAEKGVYSTCTRLLSRPYIQQRIKSLLQARLEAAGVTKDHVVARVAHLAFADLGQFATWDEAGNVTVRASEDMTAHERAAIKTLRVTRVDRVNKQGEVTSTRTDVIIEPVNTQPWMLLLGRMLNIVESEHADSADAIRELAAAMMERRAQLQDGDRSRPRLLGTG